MTRFAIALCFLLFATGSQAADALHPRPVRIATAHVVPLPRERPPEIRIAQAPQVTNPDPFNIKRTDQAPATPPAPIVVTTPTAPQPDSPLGYIWAAIASVFTALFGKLAFKLPQMPGGSLDQGKVTDIVKSVLHPSGTSILSDPALRASVDAALLHAVQSGVPGQAIQAGLGLIPGAAPFVSVLEPALRDIVVKELQKHVPSSPSSGPTEAPTDPLQAQLTALTSVVQNLIKMHTEKTA